MAERKLTKSELRLKQNDPKKFAALQKMRARRGKGFLTSKTIRDAGTGKFDSKAGTPAEQRAVAHGKKIEAETGSKDKGQKAALAMMKKSRSKSNKEIASLAVDGGLIAFGGPLAGYVGRKALQSAFGQQALKSGAGQAVVKAGQKVANKIGRGLGAAGMAVLPATAKLALRNADKAAAAATAKAARAAKRKLKNPGPGNRKVPVNKNYVTNKDGTPKIRNGRPVPITTPKGTPKRTPKRKPKTPIVAVPPSRFPQSKVGTAAATGAVIANNMISGKKKPPPKKPIVVKPTSRKVKPVDPYRYLSDNIDEEGISNKMPKKLKTLGEAMFGSDQTFRNQMVKNPFTGEPMTLDYSDNYDMKKGGSIKKKMKKGKVKKRASLRGQGKALRGF